MRPPNTDHRTAFERILIAVGVAATVTVVALTAWYAAHVFLLVFAGVLFAVLLRALADPLARHARIPSGWALAIVVLLLFAAAALVLWFYGGRIVEGFYDLIRSLPEALRAIQSQLQQYEWGRRVLQTVADIEWRSVTADVVKRIVGVFSTLLPAVASLLIILFLGLYLSAEPGVYTGGLVRLVPPRRRERAQEVLQALGYVLKWFLVGRALSMTLLFALTWAGLALLGVPLAFPLALLAGLLEFIPNIGPILSAIPAVAVAFSQEPILALWVVVLYTGLQMVESYLITPLIQREMISIPPGLLFTVQLVMGLFFGLLGLLLAAPMAAVLMVLIQRLYVEDVLGDRA